MAETTTPTWDPTSWLKQWSAAMQLAPNTLVQPILPGWTLNVNAFNSSAPQTEADVVSKHSYGRQLGRISEALAILVDARDPKAHRRTFRRLPHHERRDRRDQGRQRHGAGRTACSPTSTCSRCCAPKSMRA